jgi:hypothetical protein
LAITAALWVPNATLSQTATPYTSTQPFSQASGSAPLRRPGQRSDLRVTLYAGANALGRQRRVGVAGQERFSIGPAFTMGSRLELSTGPYVAIGVFLEFAGLEFVLLEPAASGATRGRTTVLSLGVWMKIRAPLNVNGTPVDLYLGAPIGMSAARADAATRSDSRIGLALGGLGGVDVFFTERFGAFLEAGVLSQVYVAGADEDEREFKRVGFLQATVRIGASLAV